MKKVFAGRQFIGGKPGTETAESSFTDRLFLKAGRMKSVLIPEIEFTGFLEFIICEAIEILKDQSAYQNINRCVWTRVTLFTI